MSTADLLAGTVMNLAASLLNDTARTVYTYVAQLPYLTMAMQELEEFYELHSISVTQVTSAEINIPQGQDQIVFNGLVPVPSLPDDFIEAKQLWEREEGINPWIPMTHRDFLPHNMNGVETNQFIYWTYNSQKIQLLPANQDNDIKMDYVRNLFLAPTSETSPINVVNAQTFLQYRTASLCAEFIERNITSANALNQYAILALDRATGIAIKGKQNIATKRRPFRAGYKTSGWI